MFNSVVTSEVYSVDPSSLSRSLVYSYSAKSLKLGCQLVAASSTVLRYYS